MHSVAQFGRLVIDRSASPTRLLQYKNIVSAAAARSTSAQQCSRGKATAESQSRAAELASTLAQLQERLSAQQARVSPRGSPRKGAASQGRPSSLLLRNAEQQLCELTARLEMAQGKSEWPGCCMGSRKWT